MAMSELKQKLLQYELKMIGFPDAVYIPESDKIKIQPDNDRMPFINDAGEISYGSEQAGFVMNTLKPLVDRVNEVTAAWELSYTHNFKDISKFRIMAEYNDVVLAARDDTMNGRGLHFVTWEYNHDHTGLNHGHYTEDYNYAKEDFAGRSGLIPKEKLFTPEQAAELKAVIEYRIENDGGMTYTTENALKEIVDKLSDAYPAKTEIQVEPSNEHAQEIENQIVSKPTAKTLFGDVQSGDWVIAAGNNDYKYLIGTVISIEKIGSPEHETENLTDDIHVDFTAFEYPAERIAEIEEHFSYLYGEPKTFDELPLDDVIMSPQMLIRITHLGQDEIEFMGNLRQNCESFCNCFPDGGEPQNGKHAELNERINKNLSDYHSMLGGFGNRELIEMADKISAMANAHLYMADYDFDDDGLDFFLQFQNPLEIVADAICNYGTDLEYVSDLLYGILDKQDALVDYPLMSDIEPPQDESLRRYMDIDLELYLGKIAEKVIIHYPNDWNTDLKTLHKAAVSDNPEDKRLMWHVCGFGTHLNTERETFIRDTGAFNTWVDYRPRDDDMFGYAVEVTGYDGGIIKGNVFEVGDYYAHSLHVRDTALPLDSVSLTYSDAWGVNAEKTVTVPRNEYDNDRHRLMSESGDVTAIHYHPSESLMEMSELLRQEHAKRMALPIGSTSELLRKMANKLSEVRKIQEPSENAKQSAAHEQDFVNKMNSLIPGADADGIKNLIAHAKELEEGETITKNEFFNYTFNEFTVVTQKYGEETARQLLDVCKTFALDPFEIHGAAHHLSNGVESSAIAQLALDGYCDAPNDEPLSPVNGDDVFINGQSGDNKPEISKPLEKLKQAAAEKPKPKTLAEKMQAAQEKVKAQDAQGDKNKSHKREERE